MGMEIEKAHELGFCFGVRRAIKLIKQASIKHRGITTLGPIVHNRLVVDELAELGINSVATLAGVKGKSIAISSHGVSPHLLSRIVSRKLDVIDTTCPTVRSAQKAVKKLAEAGFGVIIFGEAEHPEVKGLLGWAGKNAFATMDGDSLAHITLSKRLGIVSQTTQSRLQFADFVKKVISVVFPKVNELHIINTICDETQKRQQAAVELAHRSDLIIVVGGHNSANTKHLAEICSPLVETHQVETAAEIKRAWLNGKKHIGITAGTSTPDESIEGVLVKLQKLSESSR